MRRAGPPAAQGIWPHSRMAVPDRGNPEGIVKETGVEVRTWPPASLGAPRAWARSVRGRGVRARAVREGLLLAGVVAIALFEKAVRPELSLASLLVGLALVSTLPWRRSRPLLMVAIAFGATASLSLYTIATGSDLPVPHATAFLLVLPYALARRGTGRQIALGAPIMLAAAILGFVAQPSGIGDLFGAFGVLGVALASGATVRSRAAARAQALERAELRERERLARELHDTVAHHVSAIAIRAQAGLVGGTTRPDAALDALRVIENEASSALTEMRTLVRVLRDGEAPDRAPAPGIDELERLAARPGEGPTVTVRVSGDAERLAPSVSAAVYRLAREAVTNARRHARHPTRIVVNVVVGAASVRLHVDDDGTLPGPLARAGGGYGLVGMRERAEALGGTFEAGPGVTRGWTVTAVLPRQGAVP